MTPESALARTRKLLALAAEGSGAAPEEARNAAQAAANLIIEHALLDGRAQASPIDIDQVADLALHAAELEHLLAAERAAHAQTRAAHAAAIRGRDQQWKAFVEKVRKEERDAARAQVKTMARKAIVLDRAVQGRAGGRARDLKLSADQKSEIGRAGAEERWRRWREERGLPPR